VTLDVLIVKTSSLGDVVHALPVLSDIQTFHPDWNVGWVVEEPFAAIPRSHPFCKKVLPVAMRRWRRGFPSRAVCREWSAFKADLTALNPRYVLDLQGLLKSAWIARHSPGVHLGYRWGSARENLATLFYDRTVSVSWHLHAVERNRQLAAAHLGYTTLGPPRYGLAPREGAARRVLFIHSTSRDDKLWDEVCWQQLGQTLMNQGWSITLLAGNAREFERSERLARALPGAYCHPLVTLDEVMRCIAGAGLVVGVDTGLSHLATALDVPTVAVYVATDPQATGVYGSPRAVNLGTTGAAPTVAMVLEAIKGLVS
jgi:heptosyltransferase-1